MLLIFLASIWIRFRRPNADWKRAALEELFVAGCLAAVCVLLPEFLFKPFITIYFLLLAIDELLHRRLGIRLRPELFSHFLQPSIYWSSAAVIRKEIVFTLIFLSINETSLWIVSGTPPLFATLLIAIGWIQSPKDHFLLLAAKDLFRASPKRKKRKTYSFAQEDAIFLSRDYPLLRITRSFLGEKQFSIDMKKGRSPHIIFFFLESFRSRNVGCLGAKDPLTPHFDALSRDGVLFPNFYSNSNSTSWAMIASLFGLPASMARSYLHYYIDFPMIGLPQIMQNQGYHSALIQGSHLKLQGTHAFFQTHGFQTIIGPSHIERAEPHCQSSSWGVHDEALGSYSIEWLKQQHHPVFLSLFSITNHHPWISPAGWEKRFGVPYYDTFAYTDWALGEWIRRLKEADLMKDSILFILGDHGQAFGEHDPHFESHRTLYEEDVRVPLLILAPGRLEKPVRIDDPCSQIDLLPTILDLFASSSPHHSMGISLMRKKKRFVYCNYPFDETAIAGRLGSWKGIVRGSQEQLFHLKSDPFEQRNLVNEQPRRWRRLKKMMLDYHDELQSLYESRAVAPNSSLSCCGHYVPPKEIQDEELARSLALKRPLFSLDLSNCFNITGRTIADCDLIYLNLSNCIRLTDSMMGPLMRSCPKLSSLSLAHCLLLSDAGIADLLRNCQLEELHLQGLDELCEMLPLPPVRTIRLLNLLECPRLDGASWSSWIASLPALKVLRLSCTQWTDLHLERLSEEAHSLINLHLTDAFSLSSEAIHVLIAANPHLIELTLEDCPQINDRFLEKLQGHSIRSITLRGCLRISDRGLMALQNLPLERLTVQNCPGISGEALMALQGKILES